tara:strand:+ start:1166 stop:1849 length:684 start_codon:yes stop_codon:yes gene_type:complete
MLIKCPNCNAQYDVPNDIIPAAGRDVQCSSCSKTWFVTAQSGRKTLKDKVSNYKSQKKRELSKFETTESFLTNKATKDVDKDVLEILREEADHEIRARGGDGDLDKNTQKLSSKGAIKNSTKSKRKVDSEALPDNIEIGTTLEENLVLNYPEKESIKSKSKSGKVGFFVGLVVIGICWGAYTFEDFISRSVPKTTLYIDFYKNYIDYILEARDDILQNLIEEIRDRK